MGYEHAFYLGEHEEAMLRRLMFVCSINGKTKSEQLKNLIIECHKRICASLS